MSEAGLITFWQGVAQAVIDQFSDLFGARLVTGQAAVERGEWGELVAHLPTAAAGAAVALPGKDQFGLILAATDSGGPAAWLESREVRQGLWDAVEAGLRASLSLGGREQVTIGTQLAAGELDQAIGLSPGTPGVLLMWEAAGDGVAFTLGFVLGEDEAASSGQPAGAARDTSSGATVTARSPRLPPLRGSAPSTTRDLDLIIDLPLHLTVEIGSAKVLIKDMLALGKGSVIELDRPAGEWVDVLVNGKLVARGEIVVLPDGDFGVRIAEIINSRDRLGGLPAGRAGR